MGSEYVLMVVCALSAIQMGLTTSIALGEVKSLPVRPLLNRALVCVVLAILTVITILFSLGRPSLLINMIVNPQSPFFGVALSMGFTVASLLGYIVSQYRYAEQHTTTLWSVSALFASIALLLATGELLVMPWKAAWNTHWITLVCLSWGAVISLWCLHHLTQITHAPVPLDRYDLILLTPLLTWGGYGWHLVHTSDFSLNSMSLSSCFLLALTLLCSLLVWKAMTFKIFQTRHWLTGLIGILGILTSHALIYQLGMPTWHLFPSFY